MSTCTFKELIVTEIKKNCCFFLFPPQRKKEWSSFRFRRRNTVIISALVDQEASLTFEEPCMV